MANSVATRKALGPFVGTILGDYFVSFDPDTQVTGLINVVLIYLFYTTQMILSELATYNPNQQFGNMYQRACYLGTKSQEVTAMLKPATNKCTSHHEECH